MTSISDLLAKVYKRHGPAVFMASVTYGDEYYVTLMDGYVSVPARQRKKLQSSQTTFEQMMATNLYRFGKRLDAPPQLITGRPNPLHIWVIGREGWLEQAPELIRLISEDDKDASYRVVIYGARDPQESPIWMVRWPRWLRRAGMMQRKKHKNLNQFRSAGRTLLEVMHKDYEATHEPPTHILEEMGLPCAFHGD